MRRFEINAEGGLHFTVGSLRHTRGRSRGVDFRSELGLLKAALLYADHVRLVSVGASTVAAFDALGKMPAAAKLELIRDLLPQMRPDASSRDLQNV